MTAKFPKESKSQEIGRIAGKVFDFVSPTKWICTELAGDTDFGIDYQVQLKDTEGNVKYSFKLQLKGTTQNKVAKCGSFVSYQFDASTLNLYKNDESLVVVVLVDFSKHGLENRSKADVYYKLLDSEFFDDIAEKVKTNDKVSVRLPTTNIFNESVEIEDYYKNRVEKSQTFNKLGETICTHSASGLEAVNKISSSINSKPNIIDALTNQTDAPWIDNPKGSIAASLKDVDTALSRGNVTEAKTKLDNISGDLSAMTKGENAEFHLLWGRVLERRGQHRESLSEYQLALKHSEAARYVIQYIEGHFKLTPVPKDVIKDLMEKLEHVDPIQCILKAKCLIVCDEVEQGLRLIDKHHPEKLVSKMLLLMIAGKTRDLDSLIEGYDKTKLPDERSKFIYYGICSRRLTEKVIGQPLHERKCSVPITGEASYDRELVLQAKESCDLAWKSAKNLGYPGDTMTLFDTSMLIYGFCNQPHILMGHMKNMLAESPENEYLIRCYSILLFNSGYHQKLYELLNPKEILAVDEAILFAMSCFYLKEYPKMLEVVKQHESAIIDSTSDLVATLICLSEGVASELFELEDEARFTKLLSKIESGEHLRQIRNFIENANQDSDNLQDYAEELYKYYIANDKPLIIAFQLLPNFDCKTCGNPEKIIALGEDILCHRELTEDEYFHFCNALIAVENWEHIEEIANKQISLRYVNNQWYFLKALAHHNRGEVGKSLQSLEELFKSSSNVTINNVLFYTEICLKLGLLDKAKIAIRSQISKAKKVTDKKQLLRALIHIYTYNGPSSLPEFAKIVKQYGRLVDKTNEQEESAFLMLFFFSNQEFFDKTFLKSVQVRLGNFLKRFPKSQFLRKENMCEDDGAEAIIEKLKALAGIDKDLEVKLEENKLSIRSGALPMPLCYLHKCIRDTNDIFQSWEMSKNVDNSQLEYKIRHAPQSNNTSFIADCNKQKVLLEETFLLTMCELGYLSKFLGEIDEFFLLQSVFDNLTSAAHAIGGSLCSHVAKDVLSSIQVHVHKLKLITIEEDLLKTYCNQMKFDDVILLTDDAQLLEIVSLENDKPSYGNSIDCLTYLLEYEIISTEQFYEAIVSLSHLGFVTVNMKLSTLNDIIHFYHGLAPDVILSELPCGTLLANILNFPSNISAVYVCKTILEMSYKSFPTKLSVALVKLLLDSCQDIIRDKFLAYLFVSLSIPLPIERYINLFGASPEHVKLWKFIRVLNKELKVTHSDQALFSKLLSSLSILDGDARRLGALAVSGAFFDDSFQMKSLNNIIKS